MTSTNATSAIDAVRQLNASDVDMPEGVLDSLTPEMAQESRDRARFYREVLRIQAAREAQA